MCGTTFTLVDTAGVDGERVSLLTSGDKYQPYVGRSECLTCEKGGYCGDVTALNGGFQPCPNGTYNPFDGIWTMSAFKLR